MIVILELFVNRKHTHVLLMATIKFIDIKVVNM